MDMFERFSNLQLFSKEGLGSIRTLQDEIGRPWFVGADVCKILSMSQPSTAYKRLDEDEKYTLVSNKGIPLDDMGRVQSLVVISESGLYALIMGSRKPEARPFQKWVTNEVLPSIRENGGYIYGQENLNEKDLSTVKTVETDLADRVSSLIRENNDLEKENTALHEKNEILEGKNNYLKVRRRDLRQDVNRLKEVKRDLKNDVRHLRNEVSIRNRDLSDYEDIIERQARDYARLYKEVKELRGEIPPEPEKPKNEPVFYIDPASGLRFSSMEEIFSNDGLLEKDSEKEDSPSNAIDNEAEEEYEL